MGYTSRHPAGRVLHKVGTVTPMSMWKYLSFFTYCNPKASKTRKKTPKGPGFPNNRFLGFRRYSNHRLCVYRQHISGYDVLLGSNRAILLCKIYLAGAPIIRQTTSVVAGIMAYLILLTWIHTRCSSRERGDESDVFKLAYCSRQN